MLASNDSPLTTFNDNEVLAIPTPKPEPSQSSSTHNTELSCEPNGMEAIKGELQLALVDLLSLFDPLFSSSKPSSVSLSSLILASPEYSEFFLVSPSHKSIEFSLVLSSPDPPEYLKLPPILPISPLPSGSVFLSIPSLLSAYPSLHFLPAVAYAIPVLNNNPQ